MENIQETINNMNNVQETLEEFQKYFRRIKYLQKFVETLGIDVNKAIDNINNADPNKYNPIIGKLLKTYQEDGLTSDELVDGIEKYCETFNPEELTPIELDKYNKLKKLISFYKTI